ncbi:hypothetical protein F5148DRAFT_980131 [Russula earlei]|uniref:Uncharacterized protein n=1 Tax=Russula earlei TaxID=71964 RepID=A0ACC0U9P9_9AGAM|nr:hypothetical protein F5148DRAFT_980131 [Russula earlei]
MTAIDGVNGTVCNAAQYAQSLISLNNPNPWITCLTNGESIGLALTAEASFLSCASVVIILILICRNVLWYRKTFPGGDWKLFQGPADIYMFTLFLFDILQAMGGILDVRWAHNGIVTKGAYCNAQGIIQQIGELGVALTTLLLAVHTFVGALWRVGLDARRFAFGLVCLVCVFIALWVSIGASTNKNYEAPTPYWCWISPKFKGERLGGEYVWLWVALFASAFLYIPLYFWTEGRLSVDPDSWYKFHTSKPDQTVEYAQRRASLGMLLYPLAYSFVVLPLSVARWMLFSHDHVSSASQFFGVSMFNLSGFINVLLFLIVRPQLLLFPRPEDIVEPEIQLAHDNGSRIFTDAAAKYELSPEPAATGYVDGGSRTSASAEMSRGSSRRRFDEDDV